LRPSRRGARSTRGRTRPRPTAAIGFPYDHRIKSDPDRLTFIRPSAQEAEIMTLRHFTAVSALFALALATAPASAATSCLPAEGVTDCVKRIVDACCKGARIGALCQVKEGAKTLPAVMSLLAAKAK